MGSTAKAIVTGFICRLCSEQKKVVIHLYTERAKKLELLKKIKLLPISVSISVSVFLYSKTLSLL